MTYSNSSNASAHGGVWEGINRAVNFAQLITLVAGLFFIAMKIGGRDKELEHHERSINELRSITSDMARTQTNMMSVDAASLSERANLTTRINDLQRRLERLETIYGRPEL